MERKYKMRESDDGKDGRKSEREAVHGTNTERMNSSISILWSVY